MEPFFFEKLDPLVVGIQFVNSLFKLRAVVGVELRIQFLLSDQDFSQFEEDELAHVLVCLLKLQLAESVASLQ